MTGDTEITDYHYDELPALEFYMNRECVRDDDQTTTLEIKSGQSVPHTTIRLVPSIDDPTCYHVLWWTFGKGDDLYHAFTLCTGEGNGYEFLRRVLDVIGKHEKEVGGPSCRRVRAAANAESEAWISEKDRLHERP